MLIILTGTETIHKRLIAREILAHLNTFKVRDYTVDFKKDPLEVFNSSGELIYRPDTEEITGVTNLFHNEEGHPAADIGQDVLQEITDLQSNVFFKQYHYRHVFSDPFPDFGFYPGVEIFSDDYSRKLSSPHRYSDILDAYENRIIDNLVITGSFSKLFIDKIRQDLGNENVTVINISRHPSVSFLLHQKIPQWYIDNPLISEFNDDINLRMSLLNVIKLKEDPNVITVKFEDIIANGCITVLGVDVPLPPGYTKYNSYLTTLEVEEWLTKNEVLAEMLDLRNTEYVNYDILVGQTDDPSNRTLRPTHLVKLKDVLPMFNQLISGFYNQSINLTIEQVESVTPKNLFIATGYLGLLTKNEICNL